MNIQDWIPYPENKPTRFGEYLVTLEYIYPSYRGYRRVTTATWFSDYGNGQQPHWSYINLNPDMEKVVAWTTLPDSYEL